MNTAMPARPRGTQPPWLVPTGIGIIIVLLAALIVIVLNRGDNPSTSAPGTTTETTGATMPATTLAATTTTAAVSTTTTATPTTIPATTTPAAPSVAAGQAMLVADGATRKFSIAATCSDFWAGVRTTSHVLLDKATNHVWVVDVLEFEEGGAPTMRAIDMDYAIAANVFGQDTPRSPTFSGDIDNAQAGVARAAMKLTSGDGPASIELSLGEPATIDDCAVGTFTSLSPFAPGSQVAWVSPDNADGQRFNVLAACGGELLLTGGGMLITTYPENGATMMAGLVNSYNLLGDEVWWTNLSTPKPIETAFQQGGGGDITAAINVYPDGNQSSAAGYLSWTERPLRSSVGDVGLLDDVCTATP